jgi:hypothetical protein
VPHIVGRTRSISDTGQSGPPVLRRFTSGRAPRADIHSADREVRNGPRPCENRAIWGAPAHLAAAELLIRWHRPLISMATKSFKQALIWPRRGWPHARIASSNPPTPMIAITRFMLYPRSHNRRAMLGTACSARDPTLRQSASSDAPQVAGNPIARITANRAFSHSLGQELPSNARGEDDRTPCFDGNDGPPLPTRSPAIGASVPPESRLGWFAGRTHYTFRDWRNAPSTLVLASWRRERHG